MTTKEKLLKLLEDKNGAWLSGEEIARSLNVSRTAIWKAVNTLRAEGFDIQGAQNKGYCLARTKDIITEEGIKKYLQSSDITLEILPVATSTNTLLRDRISAGIPENYVLIANAQTQGRGRLGRQFFSPADTGIYLSMYLRPLGMQPEQAVNITTIAAVAAARAIERISGRDARIKWVNDIFIDERKVCGILTEGSFNIEAGALDFIILGIGFNAYAPGEGFPEEIANTAGYIFNEQIKDGKNRLAAAFLDEFTELNRTREYAEEYRERSFVIGRSITVISGEKSRPALALDVDKNCRLVVRYDDGSIATLSSGDVSLKL